VFHRSSRPAFESNASTAATSFCDGTSRSLVSDHAELDTGMLRSILRQAGVSPDEFRELL
jgi:hypothetical protein